MEIRSCEDPGAGGVIIGEYQVKSVSRHLVVGASEYRMDIAVSL